ncbi:MAG TPA: NUDIX hydrolase [Candidatus Lokiarchaeia archaeon]|nr:NUDIX hydrolase [Candidatus Lokiarchaeia archaeon]
MKVIATKEIAASKWLSFKEATYIDKIGKEQTWQYIERQQATAVVSIICRAKNSSKYLFIAQPRVPINKIAISFPAGLVDQGETPDQAALRELKEETGYHGTVKATSTLMPKSAGLTTESATVVFCEVDPAAVGKTEMEETEEIQSFWLTPAAFKKMIAKMNLETTCVELDTWNYIAGLTTPRPKRRKSRR